MAAKAGMHYKTKNRDALVTYLQSREGEHVTVNEIHDHFRKIGNSMGVATIYRQLEKLVAEGQMRKYVVDSGSAACFEYIGARQGHARFIHCKCEKCGKVLHVERIIRCLWRMSGRKRLTTMQAVHDLDRPGKTQS